MEEVTSDFLDSFISDISSARVSPGESAAHEEAKPSLDPFHGLDHGINCAKNASVDCPADVVHAHIKQCPSFCLLGQKCYRDCPAIGVQNAIWQCPDDCPLKLSIIDRHNKRKTGEKNIKNAFDRAKERQEAKKAYDSQKLKSRMSSVGKKQYINTVSGKIKYKDLTQEEIDKFNILLPKNNIKIREPIPTGQFLALSPIFSTTMTAVAKLEGVKINYLDMSPYHTTEHVKRIKNNFEDKIHHTYVLPKEKNHSRGRKKKAKPNTGRKPQGSGECMNSQISFYVYVDDKEYKIKAFNGTSVQVPGIKAHRFNNFLKAIKIFEDHLRECFAQNEQEIRVAWVKPTVKNYKLFMKLRAGHMLDLNTIYNIFYLEVLRYQNNFQDLEAVLAHECNMTDCQECAKLDHVRKYNHKYFIPKYAYYECPIKLVGVELNDETGLKVTLVFYNGVIEGQHKHTKVNIYRGSIIPGKKYYESFEHKYWGAKLFIMGGLYEESISDIYKYLNCIFTYFGDEIQINMADIEDQYALAIYDDNVDNPFLRERLGLHPN